MLFVSRRLIPAIYSFVLLVNESPSAIERDLSYQDTPNPTQVIPSFEYAKTFGASLE